MENKPLLSILIPITPDRVDGTQELMRRLKRERMFDGLKRAREIHGELWRASDTWICEDGTRIDIEVYCDGKVMSIGEKREKLYSVAKGVYSWQIDSDDLISEDAIDLILEAIKENPDCITFREKCMIDGVYYPSNFSLKYDKWEDNVDGFAWVRTPFYKCVIKTEIAKRVPFEHIRYNEDERWAIALKPHLKTEKYIDKEIYYYIHNSTPHHERYGFDKD